MTIDWDGLEASMRRRLGLPPETPDRSDTFRDAPRRAKAAGAGPKGSATPGTSSHPPQAGDRQ